VLFGDPGRIRTSDIWFWRPTFCQTELPSHYLEHRVGLEPTTLRICNPLHWPLCHLCGVWRRARDSNPRYRFKPVCLLSREVPSTTRPALRDILPVTFVFFLIGFAHVNDVVEITGTATNILFATVSEDCSALTPNKIMPMYTFDNVATLTALTLVNNYNFSCPCWHNDSFIWRRM
jgi:hypothetical protein